MSLRNIQPINPVPTLKKNRGNLNVLFSLYIYRKFSLPQDRLEGIQKNVQYQGILEFNAVIPSNNYKFKST